MKYLTRFGLIILLPFLPLTFIVDVLFGNALTGTRIAIKEKLNENYELFIYLWACEE